MDKVSDDGTIILLVISVGIELVLWDGVQISGETIQRMYGKYMGQWAIECRRI
jgi:hypothetical protein